MNSIIIHNKKYDGESIVDLGRDISEMLDKDMNPVCSSIPTDQWGLHRGVFHVTVQWFDNQPE